MYVRFAISAKDSRSRAEQGLFHAAEDLRVSHQLAEYEESLLLEIFAWFNQRLPHPDRFARSTRPNAECKAVSWFKDTAAEFITHMEELAAILANHDKIVERLTTDRPGYIVYEDDFQIVAEPFRGRQGE